MLKARVKWRSWMGLCQRKNDRNILHVGFLPPSKCKLHTRCPVLGESFFSIFCATSVSANSCLLGNHRRIDSRLFNCWSNTLEQSKWTRLHYKTPFCFTLTATTGMQCAHDVIMQICYLLNGFDLYFWWDYTANQPFDSALNRNILLSVFTAGRDSPLQPWHFLTFSQIGPSCFPSSAILNYEGCYRCALFPNYRFLFPVLVTSSPECFPITECLFPSTRWWKTDCGNIICIAQISC